MPDSDSTFAHTDFYRTHGTLYQLMKSVSSQKITDIFYISRARFNFDRMYARSLHPYSSIYWILLDRGQFARHPNLYARKLYGKTIEHEFAFYKLDKIIAPGAVSPQTSCSSFLALKLVRYGQLHQVYSASDDHNDSSCWLQDNSGSLCAHFIQLRVFALRANTLLLIDWHVNVVCVLDRLRIQQRNQQSLPTTLNIFNNNKNLLRPVQSIIQIWLHK